MTSNILDYTIDVNTCTPEQLKDEIDRFKSIKEDYYNIEQSIKIYINSIYGATGSAWFKYYNVNMAEAVTLQGQDLSKYASTSIDEYFHEHWHLDTELHKLLGLTYVNKLPKETHTIYMDTDSTHKNAIVHTTSGIKTIEQWYNENKDNFGGNTIVGHESVKTNDFILNWSSKDNLYFAPVKRIIRHKVTKSKWKLRTKSGKEVIITNDHSLVIFRNNKKIEIKPKDVIIGDKVICILKTAEYLIKMEFYFDEIESCKKVGVFNNEYVYDVEVDDDTHTFIADDVLIHNSVYVTFEPILASCDYAGDKVKFILDITNHSLAPFVKQKYDEYAKRYNTKNIQNLELEKISRRAIMVAKKKYVLDLAWKDPGVFFEPQEKVKYVGIEIVQGSTPRYARKVLKDLVKMVLKDGKSLNYSDVIKKLKDIKADYIMQSPEDIAKTQAIGDYEKYVIEDKSKVTLALKCPQNNKAAAIYNHKVYNDKRLKKKYNILRTGDKVKFYYTNDEYEVFGFVPGNFPYEFAPPVNYDIQFAKTIIEPFNRIMVAVGFNPIPENLLYTRSLF